jgi:cholinesterase
LLELYPNDPAHEVPFYITNATIFPSKGLQWRRQATIAGDLVMIAGRRILSQLFSSVAQTVYSYRFDTALWNAAETDGVKHFVNVVFSFQNISGALGSLPEFQSYADLSHKIGQAYVCSAYLYPHMWKIRLLTSRSFQISFVHHHDPNVLNPGGGNVSLPLWPPYSLNSPRNMVLNDKRSFVEADTFRGEGIEFISR